MHLRISVGEKKRRPSGSHRKDAVVLDTPDRRWPGASNGLYAQTPLPAQDVSSNQRAKFSRLGDSGSIR
jgi:hypothetical protein